VTLATARGCSYRYENGLGVRYWTRKIGREEQPACTGITLNESLKIRLKYKAMLYAVPSILPTTRNRPYRPR
jgi:hypothetical protein